MGVGLSTLDSRLSTLGVEQEEEAREGGGEGEDEACSEGPADPGERRHQECEDEGGIPAEEEAGPGREEGRDEEGKSDAPGGEADKAEAAGKGDSEGEAGGEAQHGAGGGAVTGGEDRSEGREDEQGRQRHGALGGVAQEREGEGSGEDGEVGGAAAEAGRGEPGGREEDEGEGERRRREPRGRGGGRWRPGLRRGPRRRPPRHPLHSARVPARMKYTECGPRLSGWPRSMRSSTTVVPGGACMASRRARRPPAGGGGSRTSPVAGSGDRRVALPVGRPRTRRAARPRVAGLRPGTWRRSSSPGRGSTGTSTASPSASRQPLGPRYRRKVPGGGSSTPPRCRTCGSSTSTTASGTQHQRRTVARLRPPARGATPARRRRRAPAGRRRTSSTSNATTARTPAGTTQVAVDSRRNDGNRSRASAPVRRATALPSQNPPLPTIDEQEGPCGRHPGHEQRRWQRDPEQRPPSPRLVQEHGSRESHKRKHGHEIADRWGVAATPLLEVQERRDGEGASDQQCPLAGTAATGQHAQPEQRGHGQRRRPQEPTGGVERQAADHLQCLGGTHLQEGPQ